MELAGVDSITFYENNNLSITYSGDKISSVSTSGETLIFNECLHNPSFNFDIIEANNNNLLYDYMINLELDEIGVESYEQLGFLMESVYGWIPKIDLKNGEIILINDPFFAESETLDTNVSHTYMLEIKPRNISNKKYDFFE